MLNLNSFVAAERDVPSDIEEASLAELANAQPTDSLCNSLYVLHDSQDSVCAFYKIKFSRASRSPHRF